MEMDDFLKMKMLGEKDGFSPYEQVKIQNMQTRNHTSGLGIAGLVTGVSGIIVGAAAWLGTSLYGNAKAKEAKEAAYSAKEKATDLYASAIQLMNQQNANTNATLDRIIHGLEREVDARTNGDINLTATINDTVSGQQSGQLSQSQQLSNDIAVGLMTGKYSENPQKVELLTPAQAFKCGCNCGND